jgi:beta-lactamase class A
LIYSRSWSGRATAHDADAEFEAASTLKLPIMRVAFSDNHGELEHSAYWDPMVRVTRYSDHAAAVELMKSLGLAHTADRP